MAVFLNNRVIPVIIIRKEIKNIYFRFDANLNLVISCNKYLSDKEALKLIEKNKDSLERMLNKVEKKKIKEQEFWYLGSKYVVVFDDNYKDLDFQDGTIYCKNEQTLNKFIKEQTKRIFEEEIEELKKKIKTPEFTLKIRKMKTRWGVCNYKLNTITLNSELIKYKKEDLRYVIVHEMCHFYHHNHGKLFWNMVSLYYPDYKLARKDLKRSMKIESINNRKVKEWAKLKEKKYRDLENKFIIEGDHLINEAMKKGLVREIIATDSSWKIPNIPFYEVTEAVMKKISSQVSISPVIAICDKLKETEIKGNVCLLDNIQDPGNLGTIIRSAVAFNINTIILSLDTVDVYNEKVIRASEGMLFNINFIKKDLKEIINDLKKDNYTIYGTDVNKGTLLPNVTFNEKTAIIIGNEGKGMNPSLLEVSDVLIHIPMNENCESLNAGVSASIIFYEASI